MTLRQSLFTQLASLPYEVVDEIFSYVDTDSLIELFSESNEETLVGNLGTYLYQIPVLVTNRTRSYTYLGMYALTEAYIPKKKVKIIEKANLLQLMGLVDKFHIPILPLTISYHVWNIVDLEEFLTLIDTIPHTTSCLFNVEIEFDPGLLNIIDMLYILNHLKKNQFNSKIRMLLITNYQGTFKFDTSDFPSLTHFWSVGSDIRFKSSSQFGNAGSLQNLSIAPDFWGFNLAKSVVVKSIPFGLSVLNLNHTLIHKGILKYVDLPKLHTINLSHIKDLTRGEFIVRLLDTNLRKNSTLHTLGLEIVFGISPERYVEIFDIITENISKLRSLDLGRFTELTQSNTLCKFSQTETNKLHQLRLSFPGVTACLIDREGDRLFRNLTKLDLCDNDLTNVNQIYLAPCLKELYLSFNPINWAEFDMTLPETLRRFEIKHTHITNLNVLKLPEGLETLGLEVNDIETIDNYMFPSGLKALGLGSNNIKSIRNHYLPPKLVIIHLTENLIAGPIDFCTNKSGEALNLFAIYLNQNVVTDLSQFKFPNSLRVLNMDDNPFKIIQHVTFNDGLRDLSLSACRISQIKTTAIFPETLKSLSLAYNNLKQVPGNLPRSIQSLNMSFNKIQAFDHMVFYDHSQLEYLRLNYNNLEVVNLDLPGQLKQLDLSHNRIRSFSIKYHTSNGEHTSSLVSLSLSHNQLSDFTPEMINCDPSTTSIQYPQLQEIDICHNDQIKPTVLNIKPFKVKTFIWGVKEEEDQFGYAIGANLIAHSYCNGKRVEA